MSIAFRCPECQENVKVSATLAGMHTPCPSCYVSVVVPAVTVRADVEDRPSAEIHVRGDVLFHMTPPKDALPPAWRWVMSGLVLILCGGLLWLLVVAIVGASFLSQSSTDRFSAFPTVSALLAGTGVRATDFLVPVCGFLLLAGWALCLAVPREAKARRWVVAGWIGILAGGLVGAGYLITVHRFRENLPASDVTLERLGIAMGAVVWLVHIVFGVFLYALARFLQSALAWQVMLCPFVFTVFAIMVISVEAVAGSQTMHVIGTAGYLLMIAWLQYLTAGAAWQIWREI